MKKLIILFILCLFSLGCTALDFSDLSFNPYDPDAIERTETPNYFGAQFIVTNSITGLTIEDPVWMYDSGSMKYSIYQNGEITVIISVRTFYQEYPDKTIMVSKAFWADGYERTSLIQYMFHDDPHKYPIHYIKLKPL